MIAAVAGNDDGGIAVVVIEVLFFLFYQLIRYLRLVALGSK